MRRIDEPVPTSPFVINEIHADPDGTLGDANNDGTANFSDDEFVEIVNTGPPMRTSAIGP